MPKESVLALAETIAASLASREQRFSVEVRYSIVESRVYIGATKESTDEHYIIQIDEM